MLCAVSSYRTAAASAALAAALFGVALGARAGTQLARSGITELLMLLAGVGVVCVALLLARRGPVHGAPAVVGLAALAVLTGLSIGWSIAPDASYVETGRTLAYLAVFAGAVAGARLAPAAGPAVVRAILAAAVAIAAYGLASRIWPSAFSESSITGRIGLPFDYWNALGGVAALGLVPALWLGARRSGGRAAGALAFPAAGLLIATILLTQSRGALLAAVLACAVWLAFVPLRLRSLALLAVGTAGALPVAAWALSKPAFTANQQAPAAREAVAGDFGLLVFAMLAALLAAGLVATALRARHRLSVSLRIRTGVAVAAVAAVASLALLTSVAMSDRGLAGTVSDRFDELTSETAPTPTGGERLASTSTARAGYWGDAWSAFEERPAIGLGAASFELARLRYRDDGFNAGYAHGYVAQTLADLGLVGLAVSLALLAAWLAAAARATDLLPRRWRTGASWSSERAAVVALALVAVTFGIQSLVDWTWFVPGIAAMALVAAGFVAGRGPLRTSPGAATPSEEAGAAPSERADVAPLPEAAVAPAGEGAGSASPADQRGGWASPLGERPSTPRIAAAAATAVVGLLCAWAVWQPVAADRAVADSYELRDAGEPVAALERAEDAHDANPYSNDPLYAIASTLADQGLNAQALATLRQAVLAQPRDPTPWLRIATFWLYDRGSPERALEAAGVGAVLDPQSQALAIVRDQANAQIAARGEQ